MGEAQATRMGEDGRRGRGPWGLLGALVAILAVETMLARSEPDFHPLVVSDWGLTRTEAAREAVAARILCFGDSLIKCGIVPEVLEAGTGRTAYNLAAIGAPTPATFFLLERAFASGARPEALVIDASPTNLSAFEFRPHVRNWAALIGPGEAFRFARDSRDPIFFGMHLTSHLVPSIRMRLDLREAIARAVAGLSSEPAIRWESIVTRQHSINRGAFHRPPSHAETAPDPYEGGKLPSFEENVCYPAAWSPNWVNLLYLGQILTLAESRRVPVFFLIPPIHPGVQSNREARGLDAPYTEIVRRISGRFRNVVVVDARHSGYGHAQFADSHHLSSRGAVALSEALSRVIAERLDDGSNQSRWVDLPRFVESSARPRIEDVEQSQVALKAGHVLSR